MGHYLSDFETSDEHYQRVVLAPMAERVRTFDEEVKRGLVHTYQWNVEMAKDRATLKEHGWKV